MTSDVITVSPFPGSVIVDDGGNEIGMQTQAGIVPFAGAAGQGSSPSAEAGAETGTSAGQLMPDPWPRDQHDMLGAFAGLESPGAYQLEVVDRNHAPELEAVQEAQSLFHEWGLDQVTANYSWRAVQHAVAKPLTDVEIEIATASVMADLERDHGKEGAAQRIALAQSEVERVAKKRPEVYDWLVDSGLANDRWLIERLAAKAAVRAARGQQPQATPALSTPAGEAHGSGMSVAQAQARRAELMRDRDFGRRYIDGDIAAREEMAALDRRIIGA